MSCALGRVTDKSVFAFPQSKRLLYRTSHDGPRSPYSYGAVTGGHDVADFAGTNRGPPLFAGATPPRLYKA